MDRINAAIRRALASVHTGTWAQADVHTTTFKSTSHGLMVGTVMAVIPLFRVNIAIIRWHRSV